MYILFKIISENDGIHDPYLVTEDPAVVLREILEDDPGNSFAIEVEADTPFDFSEIIHNKGTWDKNTDEDDLVELAGTDPKSQRLVANFVANRSLTQE